MDPEEIKNGGENLSPSLNVRDATISLKTNQAPPRGIHEKTMLQHTFRFATPDECFQSYRLVCKSWKDAVETIRFNCEVKYNFFPAIVQKLRQTRGQIIPKYYFKYLKLFKKLHINEYKFITSESQSAILDLILTSMKKLNVISFTLKQNSDKLFLENKFLFVQLLQNSRKTLQELHMQTSLTDISEITFPKLKELWLADNALCDFENYFPIVLQNMENLEDVYVSYSYHWASLNSESKTLFIKRFFAYIAQNEYRKHCISSRSVLALDYFGSPICQFRNLGAIENKKFTHQIQYLSTQVCLRSPMFLNWDRYREILDQCTNLKAIELEPYGLHWNSKIRNFIDLLPTLDTATQEIWQERISYFNSRGIRIVQSGEISFNKALKLKLAKEAKISWKFHF